MKMRLIEKSSVTSVLLGLFLAGTAQAGGYWSHKHNMDGMMNCYANMSSWSGYQSCMTEYGDKTTIAGERAVMDLQVQTEDGFAHPIIDPAQGELTDESAVLYNWPADGSEPVPLREVPVLILGPTGAARTVVSEAISESNPLNGLVYPADPNPITLGDWMKGEGQSKLTYKIRNDGTTKLKIKIRGQLPNSLYTLWSLGFTGMASFGPFGGLPNAYQTDARGNANVERILPFNIEEVVERVMIAFHSDHQVYAGTPTLIGQRGGHDNHVHDVFCIDQVGQCPPLN